MKQPQNHQNEEMQEHSSHQHAQFNKSPRKSPSNTPARQYTPSRRLGTHGKAPAQSTRAASEKTTQQRSTDTPHTTKHHQQQVIINLKNANRIEQTEHSSGQASAYANGQAYVLPQPSYVSPQTPAWWRLPFFQPREQEHKNSLLFLVIFLGFISLAIISLGLAAMYNQSTGNSGHTAGQDNTNQSNNPPVIASPSPSPSTSPSPGLSGTVDTGTGLSSSDPLTTLLTSIPNTANITAITIAGTGNGVAQQVSINGSASGQGTSSNLVSGDFTVSPSPCDTSCTLIITIPPEGSSAPVSINFPTIISNNSQMKWIIDEIGGSSAADGSLNIQSIQGKFNISSPYTIIGLHGSTLESGSSATTSNAIIHIWSDTQLMPSTTITAQNGTIDMEGGFQATCNYHIDSNNIPSYGFNATTVSFSKSTENNSSYYVEVKWLSIPNGNGNGELGSGCGGNGWALSNLFNFNHQYSGSLSINAQHLQW